MRDFAADLRATGDLHTELSNEDVADIMWSMNGSGYWVLLVGSRSWSPSGSATSSWTPGPGCR